MTGHAKHNGTRQCCLIDNEENSNYPATLTPATGMPYVVIYKTGLDMPGSTLPYCRLDQQPTCDQVFLIDSQNGAGLVCGDKAPAADMGKYRLF